jgi:hypothetical protein
MYSLRGVKIFHFFGNGFQTAKFHAGHPARWIPLIRVSDSDPQGSALIWLSRIRIGIGNPDPYWESGSGSVSKKLTKNLQINLISSFQNGICTYVPYVLRHITYIKYIFHAKIQLFCDGQSLTRVIIWIRISLDSWTRIQICTKV